MPRPEGLTYRASSPLLLSLRALVRVLGVLVFAALLLAPARSSAQDRLELGLMAGGSYYLGDMNPSQQFKMTRPAAAFFGRYMANDRIAFRGQVGYFAIEGRKV